ncbi:hypothetical protein [Natrononativus amylolyticus]|uniref:hypothetical protein n=1 Tax=Natrononativus amylolyticus TaxID=2963434 RepID=UPI0020CEB1F5|nr:hypothetical protein [Natrononativus amylolyticus]
MVAARTVVVVLLVVLAGCGGFADGTDREPYGVDEPVDPEPEELLPGVTADGVSDPEQLHAAHFDALEDDVYEQTTIRTTADESGTVDSTVITSETVGANGTPALVVVEHWEQAPENLTADPTHEHRIWITDGENYGKQVNDSGDVTHARNVSVGLLEPEPPAPPVEFYDRTDAVEEDGDRIHLEGAGDIWSYENASFTLSLTDAGYIERLQLDAEVGDRAVEETMVLETREAFPLEEPEWVEEARAADEAE